jgi:V/A-type H+/Na+-transporting ATPase subunit I
MIAKIKKYTFLVYHREYTNFLQEIRDIGVLDIIEHKSEANDFIIDNLKLKSHLLELVRALEKRPTLPDHSASPREVTEVLAEFKNLVSEEEALKQRMAVLDKQIRDYQVWGDFSPEMLRKLADHKIQVNLFTCSASKLKKEWSEDHFIEIISEIRGQVCFALVSTGEDISEIDADLVSIPNQSLTEMMGSHADFVSRQEEINRKYNEMATSDLEEIRIQLQRIESENHYQSVLINTVREADEKLMVLQGFIPVQEINVLDTYLQKSGVVYFSGEPEPGDKIPIILKNNWFSRLFEPISKIYMLPDYRELDLTPYFAPFYMLFFGFCFGDIGYSLLYITALLIALRFVKKPEFRAIIFLGMFLCLGAIIFGILSGTIFGASIGDMNIPFISNFMQKKGIHFLTIKESMILSFILGGIQLLFGMLLKAANISRISGFRSSLPVIGWFILFVASIINGLYAYLNKVPFSNNIYWAAFGLSLFMVFFLNSPGKNPFVNFGAGLWDAYNMVVGIIGDLLSYVRLFALGMAGGMLGSSFNNIGSICLDVPYVGWLLALVVLIAGHGINIFMSTIGSFVHPLRLTFVEFYKNAGFTGGGKEYKPFRK